MKDNMMDDTYMYVSIAIVHTAAAWLMYFSISKKFYHVVVHCLCLMNDIGIRKEKKLK